MKTSANGEQFIISEEGRVVRNGRHVAYNDPLGYATIGYGHLIHKSGVNPQHSDLCVITLSEEEAIALLREDLLKYEAGVKRHIKVPLNQNQFDALVSFSFNLGADVLDPDDCTLARLLNQGNYAGAAQEFGRWVKGEVDGKLVTLEGLVERRKKERKLFETPTPTSASQEKPVSSLVISVTNVCSNLVWDVKAFSKDLGARLEQYPQHGGANQRFRFDLIGDNEWRIVDCNSGLVLDAPHPDQDGSYLHMWEWHGGANQRWRLNAVGVGTVVITSVATGKAIDVPGGTKAPGHWLGVYERNDSVAQLVIGTVANDQSCAELRVAAPPQERPAPSTISPADAQAQVDRWGFEDGVAGFQQAYAFEDLDVDGQLGPKTLAAVQRVVDNGGRLSEFFGINELRSKGNGKVRSHRALLRRLDEVRRRKGPFAPVSGYRDPAHNRRVGGASNSQHVYGTACDIPEELGLTVAEARDIGFSGIGRCGNIVLHGDVRAEGPNNTTGGRPGNPTVWDYC